jgi:peptidoglycan/xylan/chitin deacetylase (PgdA/CDA1 family)
MKKIYSTLTFYFIALLYVAQAQIPGGVCNWDNNRKAAIVLTFDDWSPGQCPIATPELLKRNLNATFFIITNNVQTWDNCYWPQVLQEVTNGNEIGNHTYTHPYLSKLNTWAVAPSGIPPYATLTDQITREVGGAKKTLEQYITNQPILTFAYPFGDYNTQVLDSIIADGHICARGVTPPTNFTYNFAVNAGDYYNLNTYPMSSSVSLASFYGQVQNVMNGGGLLTYLYHSLDNGSEYGDNWYSQVQQSALQKQLDTLVYVKDKVWVTTLVQAIKYHKEKRCASLTQTQAPDGSTWKLLLTDTLSNNAIYNQPLSIKLKTNGVNYLSVVQNGVVIPIDLMRNDSIMFRAVPDNGEITLTTAYLTSTKTPQAAIDNIIISPVPTNGILNIHATKPVEASSIAVYDISGKKIYDLTNVNLLNDIQIDMTSFKEGSYFVYIYEAGQVIVKKAIRVN